MCTWEKSCRRTVLSASAKVGVSFEPAVFWPEPAGREFAEAGGEWKTS
jgi:hypothetical protein